MTDNDWQFSEKLQESMYEDMIKQSVIYINGEAIQYVDLKYKPELWPIVVKHVAELEAKNAKHNCQQWRDEGMGCAICAHVLKGLRGRDLENAAAATEWRNTELRALVEDLEAIVERLRDDELMNRAATACNDSRHDDCWCPACEARADAIEAYRAAVLSEATEDAKGDDDA